MECIGILEITVITVELPLCVFTYECIYLLTAQRN